MEVTRFSPLSLRAAAQNDPTPVAVDWKALASGWIEAITSGDEAQIELRFGLILSAATAGNAHDARQCIQHALEQAFVEKTPHVIAAAPVAIRLLLALPDEIPEDPERPYEALEPLAPEVEKVRLLEILATTLKSAVPDTAAVRIILAVLEGSPDPATRCARLAAIGVCPNDWADSDNHFRGLFDDLLTSALYTEPQRLLFLAEARVESREPHPYVRRCPFTAASMLRSVHDHSTPAVRTARMQALGFSAQQVKRQLDSMYRSGAISRAERRQAQRLLAPVLSTESGCALM